MALTPTNVLGNPQVPGIAAEVFVPDQLIAGPAQLVTDTVTIASGAGVLARGTVLGVVTASGKYIKSASAAADGSQTPVAILADNVDATSADQIAGVYLSGEFNSAALTLGAGWTVATVKAALRSVAIWVKTLNSGLSMADPT
jgi:hypothetical protein